MKIITPAIVFSALLLAACGQENSGSAQSESSAPASASAPTEMMKSEGEVIAVVNGVELTDARISVYLKGLPPLHEDGRGEIVENMISSELLAQAAAQAGLREELREDILVAQQAVLVRSYLNKYLQDNPVTDEELQARHAEMSQQFAGRKEYLVSHILLPEDQEEQAKAVLAEVKKSPERFADIAKERSEDKGSGANGGDIGWSTPDNLVPPFAEAMQKMEPGQISDAPVQTRFGWHILHLREVRDAAAPALDGRIRQQIENEARNEKVTQHIEQLRAAATVELKEAP